MHKYTQFLVNYCAHTQNFNGFQKLIILKGKSLKVCRKSFIEMYVLVSANFKISQSGLKKIFKFFVAVLKNENEKWLSGLNSNIIQTMCVNFGNFNLFGSVYMAISLKLIVSKSRTFEIFPVYTKASIPIIFHIYVYIQPIYQ